jgi:NitT/TauT family transport system ATP-binding protein
LGDRFPRHLSGGQRKRVALAQVLARAPKLLLMDEPFASLDEQTRMVLGDELLRIWSETRKTVLFVTHSLNEAVYLADRVVVLSARPGRVVDDVAVDLPRPRSFAMSSSERFGILKDRIWQHIKHAERR